MSTQKVSVNLTETSTVPKHTPGEIHIDNVGRIWQYVKASAAITQYRYVKISSDGQFTAVLCTTTTNPSTEPAQIGCAQVAIASGSYGWVFRGCGSHSGRFAADCNPNVKIYTTSTGGVVDDTATTLINGLTCKESVGGSEATAAAYANCLMTTAAA